MNIVYILSILYLLVSFLIYKKTDKKVNIVSWVIYSICLLFCYNVVVVYFASFVNVGGSLVDYSIINTVVGTLLLGVSIFRKRYQKYYFKKEQLWLVLGVFVIMFLVGYFRFDGFTSISYESGDPSVHYRQALHFSRELELLNEDNSKDLIYRSFNNSIPISYVNCGFLINIFSFAKSYTMFTVYDSLCLILYSLLFLVTIFEVFEFKKKNYLYMVVVTLLYALGFPLNNMIFGFCYLGLGIMSINLVVLLILWFKDEFDKGIVFKLILLFIISLSLFLAYYLFVPCIYLALGLYFIYLFKKKKISFVQMALYGGIGLIIPFGLGFIKFMLPTLVDSYEGTFVDYVGIDGDRYKNYTPIILYFYFVGYLIFDKIKNKKKRGIDFITLVVYIISIYIGIFFILWLVKYSALYYFYKLFYLYWLFVILIIGNKLINNKRYIYIVFCLIVIGISTVIMMPYTKFSNFLSKLNIYNWNAIAYAEDRVVYNEKEFDIVNKVVEYKDVCEYDNKFMIIDNPVKNMWYYSITGSLPVLNEENLFRKQTLFGPNITFNRFMELDDYECAVYFYRTSSMGNMYFDEDIFEKLFENEAGVIVRKR